MSTSAVWLITGCSTGIGREIARAALAKGYRVAATARDAVRVEDLVAEFPEQCVGLSLDVTRLEQIEAAVRDTEAALGPIDVLVNNAAYGYVAALEEGEDAEVRAMWDTNYFGVVNMIKAVLPSMRSRRSGYIVNISSMTGLVSNPGALYYSSSKFAMESISEGLRKELAPLGIRVSAVEPGAFRTDWGVRSMKESPIRIADYEDTVGVRRVMMRSGEGAPHGDPRRVGEAVVMLAELPDPPLHLLVGADVYGAFRTKLEELDASLTEWEAFTLGEDASD